MRKTSSSWIIKLSVCFYRWLLYLGPIVYRRDYTEATLQVFHQCCRDAYQRRGTFGVLTLWLPMFSEAIGGMLAEHLSALRHAYERIEQMLPTIRRSIVITLGSFVLFGVAYLFLMRITDPRAPLDAAASAHLTIRLAFATLNWSAQIAFLIVVLGGLPLLFIALKQVVARKHGNPLALFAIRPKLWLTLIALTVILEVGFFAFLIAAQIIAGAPTKPATPMVIQPPFEIVLQLGIVTLFTFLLVAGTVLPSKAILRSEFSTRTLQYALLLIAATALAMSIAMIATIAWIVSMWVNAPQIADSLGLGPAGLRGQIGGSEGVVIVIAMMALAAVAAAFALRRGLSARTSVLV
jgi:hypothetical protein